MDVPGTLAETLDEDVLAELEAVLGPPPDHRARGDVEIEIEAEGEGTFTLRYRDGEVSAKKGFARGDPLLSAVLPRGGWPLIQRCLQAAADGFPDAPALARRDEALKKIQAAEWEKILAAVERLKEMSVTLAVDGAGTYRVARGAMDEVTRELAVALSASQVEDVLSGRNPEDAGGVKLSKDRGLVTELTAALGVVVTALRR